MTLRPIDFIGAIFNIQRAEKVQSNKTEHNFVLQDHIAKEMEREKREERNKVVQPDRSSEIQISERRYKEKGERKKASTYNRKMKKEDGEEGEIIDVEV